MSMARASPATKVPADAGGGDINPYPAHWASARASAAYLRMDRRTCGGPSEHWQGKLSMSLVWLLWTLTTIAVAQFSLFGSIALTKHSSFGCMAPLKNFGRLLTSSLMRQNNEDAD